MRISDITYIDMVDHNGHMLISSTATDHRHTCISYSRANAIRQFWATAPVIAIEPLGRELVGIEYGAEDYAIMRDGQSVRAYKINYGPRDSYIRILGRRIGMNEFSHILKFEHSQV